MIKTKEQLAIRRNATTVVSRLLERRRRVLSAAAAATTDVSPPAIKIGAATMIAAKIESVTILGAATIQSWHSRPETPAVVVRETGREPPIRTRAALVLAAKIGNETSVDLQNLANRLRVMGTLVAVALRNGTTAELVTSVKSGKCLGSPAAVGWQTRSAKGHQPKV